MNQKLNLKDVLGMTKDVNREIKKNIIFPIVYISHKKVILIQGKVQR